MATCYNPSFCDVKLLYLDFLGANEIILVENQTLDPPIVMGNFALAILNYIPSDKSHVFVGKCKITECSIIDLIVQMK